MKTKLDKDERAIERSAAGYRPVSKNERQKIENVLDRIRKTRNINIRLSENVLERLKQRALDEGLPYQSLIASILHKYVSDKLIDEAAMRRSVKLLQSTQ
jgi:predicted DNA binding CopG/RHH family protein